eukprot:CAMPEP_0177777922 /NCGR_PEP_ID=MMETSP0491_2-20121128/15653_1 /TAXON_ID=63592 /ORGANISM="Tetraselmis chuii, Strain PLY429" /LENGTH=467 /DNA_ID=CAMNT_0019297109 /DNA_START=130 /DNA_END=1533 /DNA_ORIENTATION=+
MEGGGDAVVYVVQPSDCVLVALAVFALLVLLPRAVRRYFADSPIPDSKEEKGSEVKFFEGEEADIGGWEGWIGYGDVDGTGGGPRCQAAERAARLVAAGGGGRGRSGGNGRAAQPSALPLARLQCDAGALLDTLKALDIPGANLRQVVARYAAPHLHSILTREGCSASAFTRTTIHTFLFFAALRDADSTAAAEQTSNDLATPSQWRLSPPLYAILVLQLGMQAEAVACLRWLGCAEGKGWAALRQALLLGIVGGEVDLLPALLLPLIDPTLPGLLPPPTPSLLSALVLVLPVTPNAGASEGVVKSATLGPLSRLVCHGLAAGWFEDTANGEVRNEADSSPQKDGVLWAVQTLSDLIASGADVGEVSPQLPFMLAASIDDSINARHQTTAVVELPPHFTARCHLRMQLMLHSPSDRTHEPTTTASFIPSPPQRPSLRSHSTQAPMYVRLVMGEGKGADVIEEGGEEG